MQSAHASRATAQARMVLMGVAFAIGCQRGAIARSPVIPHSSAAPAPVAAAPPGDDPPVWPETLARALAGRGEPHAQPIALPPDARGRSCWLAFSGSREVAWGAWHVWLAPDGTTEVEPVEHWPTGVRVVGGLVAGGAAYVLLESLGVLDQPSGLRGAWIDARGPHSPFEGSPMALSDVREMSELASRIKRRPPLERDTATLIGILRSASASTATLASSLAKEGADVRIAWQGLFTQRVGHLDPDGAASSPLGGAVLAIMRDALATQACGADSCEAWTDSGRAVVRFVRQDERWVLHEFIEDAPVARAAAVGSAPRAIASAADANETATLLRARTREVKALLGQAPLAASGGTIGVGLTDLAPDLPVVVVREGSAARLFAIDGGAIRTETGAVTHWNAAFADVDGDGRTDVIVRMTGEGVGGLPVAWTQAFLAPSPSVQATSLEADLASAFALMNSPDVASAAQTAASMPLRGVAHDDACRLLATAVTPAGFRRQAAPDARLLHFDEPGLPTWRPKVVPLSKLAIDDVRGIGSHCAELTCSATRPYCAWVGGADSEHFWFGWRDGRLELTGAADYDGE